MDTRPLTHPGLKELAAYALGKLSEAEASGIARHLQACAECRRTVETSPPDSFLKLIREVRPAAGAPSVDSATALPGAGAVAADGLAHVPAELANHVKFKIVKVLGQGGMGTVYRAEHRVMERPVAIKVINPNLVDHAEALQRFHAEVRTAAKLNHPNIVTAYDAEQAGNLQLLVMEYVEGIDLATYVKQKGPMSVEHACRFIRQAALGLQHAFEKGMVHRDIKPQNLMLTRKGQVKILDFGLARMASERAAGKALTQVGSFMGTPEYVSPEQAMDATKADIRADIYSLGCTLYFLLTGQPPFVENTAVKLVVAHLERVPKPVHELQPAPVELSNIVARMLAKKPERRYQTPAEVAKALEPFSKKGGDAAGDVPNVLGVPPPLPRPAEGEAFSTLAATENELSKNPILKRPRTLAKKRSWLAPSVVASGLLGIGVLIGIIGFVFGPSRNPDKQKRDSQSNTESETTKTAAEAPLAKLITNAIGMKLALIPAGEFLMGSTGGVGDDEGPPHKVKITKPFYLGVHEVTQKEYEAVMGNNPSTTRGDNLPVENVSWLDAEEFCRKLSVSERALHCLPTEAEWEYACRGGGNGTWCFGDDVNSLEEYAWYFSNASGNIHPVGQRKPNAFGLYDMNGNVSEWCGDWYQWSYYQTSSFVDPKGPDNIANARTSRVIRGGSYTSTSHQCRSAYRSANSPQVRSPRVGFRVVRAAEQAGRTNLMSKPDELRAENKPVIQRQKSMIQLQINQPFCEVFVDEKLVHFAAGGQPVKIEVADGRHELKVTKSGFKTHVEQFTTADGVREIAVRLEPVASSVVNKTESSHPAPLAPSRPPARPPANVAKKGKLAPAGVAGVWLHRVGTSGPSPITLLANGKINDPKGKNTWSFAGKMLTLRWINKNAPGGVWIDRCRISDDGKTYQGSNQHGASISGTKR